MRTRAFKSLDVLDAWDLSYLTPFNSPCCSLISGLSGLPAAPGTCWPCSPSGLCICCPLFLEHSFPLPTPQISAWLSPSLPQLSQMSLYQIYLSLPTYLKCHPYQSPDTLSLIFTIASNSSWHIYYWLSFLLVKCNSREAGTYESPALVQCLVPNKHSVNIGWMNTWAAEWHWVPLSVSLPFPCPSPCCEVAAAGPTIVFSRNHLQRQEAVQQRSSTSLFTGRKILLLADISLYFID